MTGQRTLLQLREELRLLLSALQFLTRIPVPNWTGHAPGQLARAVRHFPLVGAGVGAVGGAVAVAGAQFWSPVVAATLGVAATVWLTAALHEDGLADTADALMGAASRERALLIMKDSRIGSYGAVALVLALLLRVNLLAALLAQGAVPAFLALVASHSLARSVAVVVMRMLPHAAPGAPTRTGDVHGARTRDVLIAVLQALAVLGLCSALAMPDTATALRNLGLTAVGLTLFATAWLHWLRRRLQGHTGDTLGAAEQLSEILVLLAFCAAAGARN